MTIVYVDGGIIIVIVTGPSTVESVGGYFAAPRDSLSLNSALQSMPGQNLISPNLWGPDAPVLPTNVFNAINNAPLTAAISELRPEDAKFAVDRALAPLNVTNYSGLGYGPGPVGKPILSSFTSASDTPVEFNIVGSDPITGQPIPPFTSISIGASPLLIMVNRSNLNGLGAPGIGHNTTISELQPVFEGKSCIGSTLISGAPAVPVSVFLQSPLSGDMNTFEFTNLRVTANGHTQSQEFGVSADDDPFDNPCGNNQGYRHRIIGPRVLIENALTPTPDSVGYGFFSFDLVAPIAGSSSFGYLTLNGVDPLYPTYSNGQLPTCTAPCPAVPGTSFPNLRNGSYRSWTIMRAITDTSNTTIPALVAAMQQNVNNTVPDFVPFKAVGADPGLRLYRSHYAQEGIAPNNGLSGETESGGDVGGCIEKKAGDPGVLGCRQ